MNQQPKHGADLDLSSEELARNSLTAFFIPAPYSVLNRAGMSWSDPGSLVRGVLVNEAGKAIAGFNRTLGHAGVRVQCAATSDKPAAFFQGSVTYQDPKYFQYLLLQKQIGLGMLFDDVPGRMESPDELQASIDEGIHNGRLAYVKFLISNEVARALVSYATSFQAENVQKNYGLPSRPLHKEGAGCSAFTMSFLELAGLIEPRFRQHWSFQVRVPLHDRSVFGRGKPLIGGDRFPSNKVSLLRAAALRRPWARSDEPGVDLQGWDPTRMAEWTQRRTAEASVDGSEFVETMGKARGLVLDRRSTKPTEALLHGTYFR